VNGLESDAARCRVSAGRAPATAGVEVEGTGLRLGSRSNFLYKNAVDPECGCFSRRDFGNCALSMLLVAALITGQRSFRLPQPAAAVATLFDDVSRFDDDTTWIDD
jgi:hypothetical protein